MNKTTRLKIGLLGLAAKPISPLRGVVCAPNDIAYSLAFGLSKRGHIITVFSGKDSQIKLPLLSANLGSTWHEFGPDYFDPSYFTSKRAEYDLILATEAIKAYKAKKIDIIHLIDFRLSPYIFVQAQIPVIYTIHGDLENNSNNYDKYRFKLLTDKIFYFTNISNKNEIFCKKNKLQSLGITPNGIDIDKFGYNEKGRRGLLLVARMVKNKRIKEAIEVAKKLDITITLIGGQGPYEVDKKYFAELQKKYFCLPGVNYLGYLAKEKIISYYQKAQVLLYPSNSEGLPMGILEAMATGLPVVASNIGGIPDIIDNGKNGYLMNNFHIDEWATTVKQAMNIQSSIVIEKIKNNFSIEKMVLSYENTYYKFMNKEKKS